MWIINQSLANYFYRDNHNIALQQSKLIQSTESEFFKNQQIRSFRLRATWRRSSLSLGKLLATELKRNLQIFPPSFVFFFYNSTCPSSRYIHNKLSSGIKFRSNPSTLPGNALKMKSGPIRWPERLLRLCSTTYSRSPGKQWRTRYARWVIRDGQRRRRGRRRTVCLSREPLEKGWFAGGSLAWTGGRARWTCRCRWWWCWWWCYGRLCLAFHTRSTNRDERLHARRAGHVARSWPLSGLPCPFLSFPFLSLTFTFTFTFPCLPAFSLFPFFSSFPLESSPRPCLRDTTLPCPFASSSLWKHPPLFFVLAKMEHLGLSDHCWSLQLSSFSFSFFSSGIFVCNSSMLMQDRVLLDD